MIARRADNAPEDLQRRHRAGHPQQRQCLAAHRHRREAQREVHVLGHPTGADEHDALDQLRVLVSELHGDAAAEGMAYDGHALDVEHREQVPHAVGVGRHRVVGAGLVGLAVAE